MGGRRVLGVASLFGQVFCNQSIRSLINRRLHVVTLLLFMNVGIASSQIIINEIDVDTPGPDTEEFIELYDGGTGDTSLDGLVLVFYNGSSDLSYRSIDLDGLSTNTSGYFVVGNGAVANVGLELPDNAMQNGADAVALYTGDGADFPIGTPITTDDLLDAIVYDTNDADDIGLLTLLNAGEPQVNEAGEGDKDAHSSQRVPNGSGGARNTQTMQQLPPTPGTQSGIVANNPLLTVEPIEMQFGGVVVGSSTVMMTIIRNDGDADLEITSIAWLGGSSPHFAIKRQPVTPVILASSESATVEIEFTPTVEGSFEGALELVSNAGNHTVRVFGDGLAADLPHLAVSPLNLDFGMVLVGSTKSLDITLSSDGTSALTVTEISLDAGSNSAFEIVSALQLPLTLNPNESQTLGINYKPSAAGAARGSVQVLSSGGNASVQFAGVGTHPPDALVINEIDSDTPGQDDREFVELYDGGQGNTPLDGLVLVFYNGNDDRSYHTIGLDGSSTDKDGYFVAGNPGVPGVDLVFDNNTIQNGADAVTLYTGDAVGFPNDTPLTKAGLIDAVVYGTSDTDDDGLLILLNAGQPQVDEDGDGNKEQHSSQRIPNGSGGAGNTATFAPFPPTPGMPNFGYVEQEKLEIFEIQGSGLRSPFASSIVTTENNVVTGITRDGFFMQTPTGRSDSDEATSDGIFVSTETPPTAALGDLVDVTGVIAELSDLTAFSEGAQVTIKSSGHELPATIEFGPTVPSPFQPTSSMDFERFEGMLVKVMGAIVTAPSDRFGDIKIVVAAARAFREPGIHYPGLPDLPVWDGNPEIFEIDPDGAGMPDTLMAAGARIHLAVGPLSYNFGDYQLLPNEMGFEDALVLRPVREKEQGEITVASQNAQNFFDDVDDPAIEDAALLHGEYLAKLEKISLQIREVLGSPDILALQEIENRQVLQDLVERIAIDDPAISYTAFLSEGNDGRGIDTGFLVRKSMAVQSVTQLAKEATFEFNGETMTLFDRPPLALRAQISSDPTYELTVLAVHNRSLRGIDESDSSRVRMRRFAEAVWIAEEIQRLQTDNSKIKLIVTGDFNAFQFSDGYVDVLGQITGDTDPRGALHPATGIVEPPLVNQVLVLPEEEQYSFIFAGNAQVLDHMLTSQTLESLVTDIAFTRGNADAPEALAENKSVALRSSDHDGLVLFLKTDQTTSIETRGPGIPDVFQLSQNHPNPFNPSTTIEYALAKRAHVILKIFNLAGQEVLILLDEPKRAGHHSIRWNGKNRLGRRVPSGIYFYQITAGQFQQALRMTLLK